MKARGQNLNVIAVYLISLEYEELRSKVQGMSIDVRAVVPGI